MLPMSNYERKLPRKAQYRTLFLRPAYFITFLLLLLLTPVIGAWRLARRRPFQSYVFLFVVLGAGYVWKKGRVTGWNGAVGAASGFVVGGAAWTEEMAVQAVSAQGQESDYVVTVHVDAVVEPWTAELVFVRASDGAKIGELDAEFDPARPEEGIPGLMDEVVELLGGEFRVAGYEVPVEFSGYLARLEQLLAVRCAAMEGVQAEFLQSERVILEGNLELAEKEPANLASRLLLVETFGGLERVRPEVAAEYRSRIEKLTTEWPLLGA